MMAKGMCQTLSLFAVSSEEDSYTAESILEGSLGAQRKILYHVGGES